jgi:hypothetical protein
VPPPSKRGSSKEDPKALKGLWFSAKVECRKFRLPSLSLWTKHRFLWKTCEGLPRKKRKERRNKRLTAPPVERRVRFPNRRRALSTKTASARLPRSLKTESYAYFRMYLEWAPGEREASRAVTCSLEPKRLSTFPTGAASLG